MVICDHDAPEAYDLLRDAIASPAGYVAMMASRQRTANVLSMLRDEGADAATLERVHLPAGLNLGGKTPGEIALSVVAEIQAWSNGRTGRPMRDGESHRSGCIGSSAWGPGGRRRVRRPSSRGSRTASSGSGPRTGWPTSAATSRRRGRRGCPFCAAPARSDAEGLIVHRGEHCFVVINLFPYNPGHVLVCPYRHVSLYIDLTDEETAEFTALTKQAVRALQTAPSRTGSTSA